MSKNDAADVAGAPLVLSGALAKNAAADDAAGAVLVLSSASGTEAKKLPASKAGDGSEICIASLTDSVRWTGWLKPMAGVAGVGTAALLLLLLKNADDEDAPRSGAEAACVPTSGGGA